MKWEAGRDVLAQIQDFFRIWAFKCFNQNSEKIPVYQKLLVYVISDNNLVTLQMALVYC